jgi:predicted NUDIX family phosphoesterase
MVISPESSDSPDVEILNTPIMKPRSNAASGQIHTTNNANISTQPPKVIPRVEIIEDADADPRFRQPVKEVVVEKTNAEEVVVEKANSKQDEKAKTAQTLGETSSHHTMEQVKQDDRTTITEILQ